MGKLSTKHADDARIQTLEVMPEPPRWGGPVDQDAQERRRAVVARTQREKWRPAMVSLWDKVLAVRVAVEKKIEVDNAFRAWQESEGDGGGIPLLNGLAQWHEGQSEDVQLAFKLQDW
eukprot:COSAG04_NODE_7419_length_1131_cov_2.161822_3_plen_117_part_01